MAHESPRTSGRATKQQIQPVLIWRPGIGGRRGETDWSCQNLAVADYMHGPVIEEVDVTQTEVQPGRIVNIEVVAADQPSNHTTKDVPHLTRSEA